MKGNKSALPSPYQMPPGPDITCLPLYAMGPWRGGVIYDRS